MRWLLAFLLALSGAAAAAPCDIPELQWECVGAVEFRTEGRLLRLTQYENGDVLAENDAEKGGPSMFVDNQVKAYHYLNLSDEAKNDKVRHPFLFLGEGAGAFVELLKIGFPDGPSSVPGDDTERTITLRSAPPISLHARQTSSGEILFRVGGPISVTDGRYISGRLPPPPADYEGRQWPVHLPPPPRKVAESVTVPKPSNVKK